MNLGPHPRYRLYTSAGRYARIAAETLTGRSAAGDDVERLEREIERRFDARHAIATSMARVGIYLALKHLLPPGRPKVILSPYTVADVINMVILSGAVPVFVDIDEETCNIDPGRIEEAVDGETGGILVTHLHGLACEMEEIRRIADRRGLFLVEDAAQAFGGRAGGRRLGTIGDAGIYSFGTYKNVNAFYGGMVVTPHEDLARKIRSEVAAWPLFEIGRYLKKVASALSTDIATWPPLFRPATYPVFRYGHLHDVAWINRMVNSELDLSRKRSVPSWYLGRMRPLQARLILEQLDGVDAAAKARIEAARRYHAGLAGLPGLGLPPLRTDLSHVYPQYPVRCARRKDLLDHLMRVRRDAAAQHLKNCADLPAFADLRRDCPVARRVAGEVVLLPTYPRYPAAEIDRTIEAVRRFFG